jgi:ribonucleoside-triphosphate reductase
MQYFKLSETFLKDYDGHQPNWGYGALSYFTFKRTYARNIDGENRTEEFWETLKRVIEGVFTIQKMHCNHHRLIWDNRKSQRSAQIMFKKMWEFKFLPPGRGLWVMGTPMVYERGSAALNNCGFVSTKHINKGLASPFCWGMDMLMLGVGIGFDTKGVGCVIKAPKHTEAIHVIPDTREGWIESVEVVLAAFEGRQLPKFNYSPIRKAGMPIKGFGGVSSGHEPLKRLHEALIELLTSRIDEELTSVNITDIFNFIGRCVVSGNVRRSAEIGIGEVGDTDFINCKNPKLFKKELLSHRWASNNSVFVSAKDNLTACAELTAINGEPGYIFDDNIRAFGRMCDAPDYVDSDYAGMNPCVEQVLESYELCNVVEAFPANHTDAAEFLDTLKYAYMYAKSVGLIPTHDERTNAVMLRNRRIGLSHSGIEQAKQKFGTSAYYHDFCDAGYQTVKEWDRIYSRWLCISKSKRYTAVKPSGTVSLLAGAFPGVHFPHALYYLRSVRVASNSPLIASLLAAGYRIEPALTDPDGTSVVYFPIKEKHYRKSKDDVTIWEQLNNAAMMQRYWADNSVSVTITFKPEEKKDIYEALEMYRDKLKAVSFMPLMDHGYKQAPYIKTTEEEYSTYYKTLKELKFTDALSDKDRATDKFCSGDTCELDIADKLK